MDRLKQNKNRWLLSTFATLNVAILVWLPLALAQAQSLDPTATNTNSDPAALSSDPGSNVDTIAALNQQIADKKKHIEELKQQAATYQQAVDTATANVRDIQSQVTVIDNQIAQTNFAIQTKQEEIDTLALQMDALQRSIDVKNAQIAQQKTQLTDAVKQLDANSRTTTLALVLTRNSLADFYRQAQAVATISDSLQQAIGTLSQLKEDLQTKQNDLSQTRDDLQQGKVQLEVQKQAVVDQRDLKTQLLGSAQQTAKQYGSLLEESAQAEQQADATITALEQQLQQQLATESNPPIFSSTGFLWPAEGKITTYFHDPTYPFRCAFWHNPSCLEHSGLDISTPQGTPVRASADGVVSVVANQGFYYNADGQKTRSALNYVGLVHQSGLATRYLHLSVIYVKADQFVKQGEVIGLSGGLPGTAGAGGITTGAHVHFEVRVNGLPVDPLQYLP